MSTNKNVIGGGCDALFAVAMPDTRGAYCYLTTGDGDPPRTYTPEHANRYKSERAAKAAMTRARKLSPLKDRYMVVVPHPASCSVWLERGKDAPVIPPQAIVDSDSEAATYTIGGKWPESGFVVDAPKQPETPGSFSMAISSPNDEPSRGRERKIQ